MSNNARIFNLDESPIYHDSEGIRLEFFKRTLSIRKPYLKNFPYLESFPSLPVAGYNVYTKFVVLLQDDEDANEISESFEEPFVKPAKKKSKLSFDDEDAMTVPQHESYSNSSSSSSKRKSSSSSGDRSDHRIVEMEPVLKLSLSLKRPVTATTSSAATTSTGSGRKSSKRKFENE